MALATFEALSHHVCTMAAILEEVSLEPRKPLLLVIQPTLENLGLSCFVSK
jgi:hypothetical protein